jgi:hypothetical protein
MNNIKGNRHFINIRKMKDNSKKYNSSNAEIEKYLQELGFTTLIDKWPDKVFIRNN